MKFAISFSAYARLIHSSGVTQKFMRIIGQRLILPQYSAILIDV
jgi:hypothetical protein